MTVAGDDDVETCAVPEGAARRGEAQLNGRGRFAGVARKALLRP